MIVRRNTDTGTGDTGELRPLLRDLALPSPFLGSQDSGLQLDLEVDTTLCDSVCGPSFQWSHPILLQCQQPLCFLS